MGMRNMGRRRRLARRRVPEPPRRARRILSRGPGAGFGRIADRMAPAPQPSPTRLGRYGVVRRLGVGGMAEVYLARSRGAEGVDKLLVVKRILPDFAENRTSARCSSTRPASRCASTTPTSCRCTGSRATARRCSSSWSTSTAPTSGRSRWPSRGRASTSRRPSWPTCCARWRAGSTHAHERLDEHGRPLEIVHRDVSPTTCSSRTRARSSSAISASRACARPPTRRAWCRQVRLHGPGAGAGRGRRPPRRPLRPRVLLTELLLGRPLFHGIAEGAEIHERVRRGDVPDPRPCSRARPTPCAPSPSAR